MSNREFAALFAQVTAPRWADMAEALEDAPDGDDAPAFCEGNGGDPYDLNALAQTDRFFVDDDIDIASFLAPDPEPGAWAAPAKA